MISKAEGTTRKEIFEVFLKLEEQVFANATRHKLELPVSIGCVQTILAMIERVDWTPEQRKMILEPLTELDKYIHDHLQFEEMDHMVHPIFIELQAGY